ARHRRSRSGCPVPRLPRAVVGGPDLRRPDGMAFGRRGPRSRPLRHQGRRRRDPGHLGRPAAARRLGAGHRAAAVPAPGRRLQAGRRRRRPPRGRARRRCRVRGDHGRAGDGPGARAGPRHGAGRSDHPDQHDRDHRRRPDRGPRRARASRPHRRQRQRPGTDRRRRHRGAAGRPGRRPARPGEADAAVRGRRVPHPPHGSCCRPDGLAGPLGDDPRSPHAGDLQPRRPRRPRGWRAPAPDRRPGGRPGPVGPLHGDDARPRRHRAPRAAARRHADRHRPPGDEGRRDVRAQDPRPARRRPRVRRAPRQPVAARRVAHLAAARLPVQGHLPPAHRPDGRRRRTTAEHDRRGRRAARRGPRPGTARRHRDRVARPRRGPRVPRSAAGPPAPRGRERV
ncbi:MAG: Malonyl CoA-acyl carrier protein transacylase, partial [uncultured Nocardioidaceae bacterium]